jgi:O-antigen/teichoic acid export membrane protein
MTLKKNLIANYLGQGWNALMGFIFIPLYIKYLGIESYGLIGIFAILQAWLILLDIGMTPTLSREMARYTGGAHDAQSIRDLLRSIEIIALAVACVIAFVIWGGSNWLAKDWLRADSLPLKTVAHAFSIMGVVTALRFVEGIYRSCVGGLQRQVAFNIVNSIMATLRGVGSLAVLALVSATTNAFFIWQGAVSVLSLIVLAQLTYASLPKTEHASHFSIEALRGVMHYAGGMVTITVLSLLLTQIDKILLSKLLSLSEFGYYTVASVLAGVPQMLVAPISQAWFPRLNQLHARDDNARFVRTYHQGAQLVSVIVGSCAVIMIIFADLVLNLWTRNPAIAHNTTMLVRLLALGNLLNCLMWIPYQAQLAHAMTLLAIRMNIVLVIVIVPAIIWATNNYGAVGASAVWVILNAGYVLIGAHFIHRKILPFETMDWYKNDLAKPIATALVATISISLVIPTNRMMVIEQFVFIMMTSVFVLSLSAFAAPLIREAIKHQMSIYLKK